MNFFPDLQMVRVYTKLIAATDLAFVTVKLRDSSTVQDLKELVIRKLKLQNNDLKFYDIVMVVELGRNIYLIIDF